jgi:hypothetical protein
MISIKSNQSYLDMVIILTILILFSITSMLYLDLFPKVWMDEAWESTTAYTFQKDGTFRNLALAGVARGNQNVHFLQPRILSNIFTAPFISILGIGSVQGRLASVFMGALAVIGIYLLARKIGGIVFASLCTVFLIFDNLFFVGTRTIRPEIYVTTIAIWALFLVLDAGIASRKLFYCGILLGISLYAHPNSFLVLIAVLIIALCQVKVNQYGRILLPIALGIVIGFLPYALYVVYQDGANQFHDFWLQINDNTRAGMLINPFDFYSGALVAELERYTSYIFFPYRLPIFIVQILAIGYAFYNKTDKINQAFLIFIFVHVVLFPILISAKTSRYLTVLMPVVTILVVKMVWGMAGWSCDIGLPALFSSVTTLNRKVLIPTALALTLFVNQAGGDVWAIWQSRDCSFSPFISQVRSLVPSGAKVWGPMTFWFGFYDHPYRTPWTVDNDEEMGSFQPEYVILYDNTEIWANQSGVTKRVDPNYESMEAVRNLLTRLVKSIGVSVGSVPNSCYGNIEIFRLMWK